jgi:putative ABC transport system ATP-binding protein
MTHFVIARDVTKTYGEGRLANPVLHGATMTVRAGELVLLMGPSGSGKTTLISIVAGLMRPNSGDVELCGQPITRLAEREVAKVRRANLGFVFQNYNLFAGLTAIQNVGAVLRLGGMAAREARERALAALELVGLGSCADRRPAELSGGQKQRVAVARAIVGAPKVLIGDEITSALDSASAHVVMDRVRAYATGGTAAILVTHDRRLGKYADRIIEMEDGRVLSVSN